ncbi:MAG: hypothetical protein H7Y86_09605 [Rhizobacter sp.]|nr:hypothetical protein [Ferruginibacter sp.]
MIITRSTKLLWLSIALSIVHHADHILRIDHSGWPFLQRISPFTYSLLVYPIFGFIFLVNKKLWFRVAAMAILFLFSTTAHIFFEPMKDKFQTWAYGSNLAHHVGEQNMLDYNAEWLGVCSIIIAVALSLVLSITLLSFIKDARKQQLIIINN